MKKIPLFLQIFIGLIAGFLFGFFLTDFVSYISWMGDLFIRALKMIIVPLILTSIVSGVMNLSSEKLGKLGWKTLAYYMSTSLFAICTGLFLVTLFKPGIGADKAFSETVKGLDVATESFGSTLINIIPTNIFEAFSNGNMLSIIFFSLLVGIFIPRLSEQFRKPFVTAFNGGFELMMKITTFIIKFTPIGVFGLMAKVVAQQAGDTQALIEVFSRLGLFALVVIMGLAIHAFIVLPTLLKVIGGINPIQHLKAMSTPLLTAFSTSSSSATLPLTMEAVENNAGVSNQTTSFVLPLGATINMDGTALYECVGAIFIAQAYGLDMSIGQQLIVVFTALLASIGAAGIPMAGLVMMSVILSALGLPLEGVGLILAVDRILDMFRTSVNVWSDSCGAVLIAKTEGEKLNYD